MSEQNYDLNSLFHPDVEMGASTPKNAEEYTPSADKGQNGIYKSIIRFVTWWKDPRHSIVDKWVCWLEDPVTTRGRMVDCPSSIGKPSVLQDMFFKFRKSESIQEQRKAEIFSRKHQYTAIIQVIKDDQYKEAEGKLLIYKFGKKIYDKIDAEKKPVIGEPHEPFDLIEGKPFALIISKVGGFNNYDQSRFLDKKIPLLIPSESGNLQPIDSNTPRETVFNFLKENSPDLDKYKFKDWDQETREYVNSIVVSVTNENPSSSYAAVRNAEDKNTPADTKSSKKEGSGITTSELSLDDLNAGEDSLSNLELPDLDSNDDNSGSIGLPGDLDDALDNL